MQQQLLSLEQPLVCINVDDVDGDLQVVGWERLDINAKTDGDVLRLDQRGEEMFITCDGALILYMPRESALAVKNVRRDLDLRAVTGDVRLDNVGGDVQVRNAGKVSLTNVSRDLNVRGTQGDFFAANVGDDASIRQVRGSVKLDNVGSDLYLRDVDGDVSATVGSDAVLYVQPNMAQSYGVTAGSDILLRVGGEINAAFDIRGGSTDSIRVDLPGVTNVEPAATRAFTVGSGAATVRLQAGGDVVVTSRADEWESKVEFDTFSRDFGFTPGEIPGFSGDFTERITSRVEEATRRAMKQAGRVEAQSERVQRKVEAAMRRAEEKIRAAERRSMHMGISFGRSGPDAPRPPMPPHPPAPPSEPVSDEERLTILRMLQEKKITLQDAEKLLAALEGK